MKRKNVLNRRVSGVIVFLLLFSVPAAGAEETKLLRYPDIHGDRIVFCYGGDLWWVSSKGGTAVRLTTHKGLEFFPKFSPDGKWIAFTGQYDGDEQVYVIPAEGGVPKQLTFYPARGPLSHHWGVDNQVYGWTRKGSAILFRSLRHGWHVAQSRLFTVSPEGGLPEPLPMPVSGSGDFSPDGQKIVYSPISRDFRTWKRYEGGMAQDLYVFDLQSYRVRQVTRHDRSDRDPMWIGEKIYFTSDRKGKLNLYSIVPGDPVPQQITFFEEYDVRWPSADEEGRIVFELNGALRIFDSVAGQTRQVSVRVPDDGLASRPSWVPAKRPIESWGLSPKGERAVFSARGDIFTAPVETGPTRNLTRSSGTHDRWPDWSPDGKKIAFISDRSGEEEIYVVPQDGSAPPDRLTRNGKGKRYTPLWSPDGSQIVFGDKNGVIYVLDVETHHLERVAKNKTGPSFDYSWSPDGTFLAFSLEGENRLRSLYLWDRQDKKRRITGPFFNAFNPVWDPEGRFLFYLSDRAFMPQKGPFEGHYMVNRQTEIFGMTLRKDVAHPFPLKSDEVTVQKGPDGRARESDGPEGDKKPHRIQIDFEEMSGRVFKIPVEPDHFAELSAGEGKLFYLRKGEIYPGRGKSNNSSLNVFSLNDRKENLLTDRVKGYRMSHDGKKALIRKGNKFLWLDLDQPAGNDKKKTVSTDGLMVYRNPAEEWQQIFGEVWRRFRDFFYVENMHGYDWEAVRKRYLPLLRHVAHRSDLNYVLGEMIAELNVSHAYIRGGDYEKPKRIRVALPGARLEWDRKADRYRIARIYQGENEKEWYRSPLTEIGIQVQEGEYILEIDGTPLIPPMNPYRLLQHKEDRMIRLTVNEKPDLKGSRSIEFRPVSNEKNLIYYDWVKKNRERVDRATDGRAGYIHIPDMGPRGLGEFLKWYYGQIRKEGLVIDVRGNVGGNVSQNIIRRLNRELLSVVYSRNSEYPHPYPANVFNGSMVCLLNETSGSDGDIFPAMFRQAGLGPLIGKRSWGGVIGIQDHGPLIDGGSVFVPEFGFASKKGEWIIENYGVEPDIEVENDPQSLIEGRDLQLERGIIEVMRRVRDHPGRLPSRPPDPVRTE